MKQSFLFQVSAMDVKALIPQVSYGLEKQVELESRKAHPEMWQVTDRYNNADKSPESVRQLRQKRRGVLALIEWALGVVLLVPALIAPAQMSLLLLIGAACFASGVVLMWQNQRILLGFLSVLQGAVLCLVTLFDRTGLAKLLILGVAGLLIGAVALLFGRPLTKFERAAIRILSMWQQLPEGVRVQAVFSPKGMTFSQEGQAGATEVPYDRFEYVMETAELFLVIFAGNMTVLQKKDLIDGTAEEFRTFMQSKAEFIPQP